MANETSPQELHIETPQETSERGFHESFEKALAGMEFNEKAVQDASFDLLSNTKGYSLIRGEVVGKKDASMATLQKDQFAEYIKAQGGDKYTKEIFNRGRVMLSKALEKNAKDFENYKNLLKSEDPKDQKKLENFKASVFGQKFLEFLENVKPENQTFSNAVMAGIFDLKSDMAHIVQYGLTHFEYKNRKQRLDTLKRREASEEMDFVVKNWKTGPGEAPEYKGPADPRDGEQGGTAVPVVRGGDEKEDNGAIKMRSPEAPPPQKPEVDSQFHGPTVTRFAADAPQKRAENLVSLNLMPAHLDGAGHGATEKDAIKDARLRILGQLEHICGEKKRMSPAEIPQDYLEEQPVLFNKSAPDTYAVTLRIKDEKKLALLTMYLENETIGPSAQ